MVGTLLAFPILIQGITYWYVDARRWAITAQLPNFLNDMVFAPAQKAKPLALSTVTPLRQRLFEIN